MKINNFLENNFRRITSSGEYVPYIDGLRFIAIIMVIYHHLFLYTKEIFPWIDLGPIVTHFFTNGNYGVQVFFVISGFILGEPLIRKANVRGLNRRVLKNYYIRRVERLEPTYFIVTIAVFVFLLVIDKYNFSFLYTKLIASLGYVHNIVYQRIPYINGVAWSLEIEMQFYILAPFFAMGLSRLKFGAITLVLASIFIVLTLYLFDLPFLSLLNYVQYFWIGFLFAIIHEKFPHKLMNTNNIVQIIAFGIVFFLIIYLDPINQGLFLKIIHPFLILILFILIKHTKILIQIFSNRILTIIGGMCYSIYLTHYIIISAFGRFLRPYFENSSSKFSPILFNIILIIAVLGIGAFTFKYFERPFMIRHWWKKQNK